MTYDETEELRSAINGIRKLVIAGSSTRRVLAEIRRADDVFAAVANKSRAREQDLRTKVKLAVTSLKEALQR